MEKWQGQTPLAPRSHGTQSHCSPMEDEPSFPIQTPRSKGFFWVAVPGCLLSPCLDASQAPALGTELMKT